MNKLMLSAAAVLLAAACSPAADDKKVENPEYTGWAKQKEGTAVTYKMTMSFGGMDITSTVKNTLAEVGKDKVTIETDTTTTFMGKDTKVPTQKREVPKELDGAKGTPGLDPKTGLPEGAKEDGKEKLKVGGTEYECKKYTFKSKQKLPTGEEEVEGTVWVSDDVPGKLVKMTSKMKAGGMSMEATDISTKK